jgi:hypothetical protein
MKNFLWFYYKNAFVFGITLFLVGGYTILFSFFAMLTVAAQLFVSIFFWGGMGILILGAIGTLISLLITGYSIIVGQGGRHRKTISV